MQCKSCNTELPKRAKVCPKCGTKVNDKPEGSLKVIAIIGLVVAMIGSMMPFVQNTEDITDAYSYMNISVPAMWYLFILCFVASIILIVLKKENFHSSLQLWLQSFSSFHLLHLTLRDTQAGQISHYIG